MQRVKIQFINVACVQPQNIGSLCTIMHIPSYREKSCPDTVHALPCAGTLSHHSSLLKLHPPPYSTWNNGNYTPGQYERICHNHTLSNKLTNPFGGSSFGWRPHTCRGLPSTACHNPCPLNLISLISCTRQVCVQCMHLHVDKTYESRSKNLAHLPP